MIDYESLSNEYLTMLLNEKSPQTFFPVTDDIRYATIALIEMGFEGVKSNNQRALADTFNDKNEY